MKNPARLAVFVCLLVLLLWQVMVAFQNSQFHPRQTHVHLPVQSIQQELAIVTDDKTEPVRTGWKASTSDPFATPTAKPEAPHLTEHETIPAPVAVETSLPEFPYKKFGRMISTDGQAIDYIIREDTVQILRAGEMIDGIYRVELVNDEVLKLTYLPTNTPLQVPNGRPADE